MRPLEIQLFVNTPSDEIVALNKIATDTKIFELKANLEIKVGILAELQVIYFCNKKIENNKSLHDLRMKNGSVLRLKIKEESLQLIYNHTVNDRLVELFQTGLHFMSYEETDSTDQKDCVKSWNKLVPLRAFHALFAACYKGYLQIITELLKNSAANIGMTSQHGRNVLHVAAYHGNVKTVSLLLEQGVDYQCADDFGITPLEVASANGHLACERRIWLFHWNNQQEQDVSNNNDENDLGSIARNYFQKYQKLTDSEERLPPIEASVDANYRDAQNVRPERTRLPKISGHPYSAHLSKMSENISSKNNAKNLPACNSTDKLNETCHSKVDEKSEYDVLTTRQIPADSIEMLSRQMPQNGGISSPKIDNYSIKNELRNEEKTGKLEKIGLSSRERTNESFKTEVEDEGNVEKLDNNRLSSQELKKRSFVKKTKGDVKTEKLEYDLNDGREFPEVIQLFIKTCDKISKRSPEKRLNSPGKNRFAIPQETLTPETPSFEDVKDKSADTINDFQIEQDVCEKSETFRYEVAENQLNPTAETFSIKKNNFFEGSNDTSKSDDQNENGKGKTGHNSNLENVKFLAKTDIRNDRKVVKFAHQKNVQRRLITPEKIKDDATTNTKTNETSKPKTNQDKINKINDITTAVQNYAHEFTSNRAKDRRKDINENFENIFKRSSDEMNSMFDPNIVAARETTPRVENNTKEIETEKPVDMNNSMDKTGSLTKSEQEKWNFEHSVLIETKTNHKIFSDKPTNTSKIDEKIIPKNRKGTRRISALQRSKSMDHFNGIGAEERMLKNQIAFEKWLQSKKRKRVKSKSESEENRQRAVPEYEISFDEWLAKKESKAAEQNQNRNNINEKRRNPKLKRGITFDEWLMRKIQDSKIKSEQQNNDENGKTKPKASGNTFEKWLEKKNILRQKEIETEKSLLEQKNKLNDFKIQSRLHDPRQRTFDEWFLEKKYNTRLEKRYSKTTETTRSRRKTFPEDSNFVYQMWLNDKLKQEYKNELRSLKLLRKPRHRQNDVSESDEMTDDDVFH